MSYDQHEVPPFPERDEHGGDELPTYDDLAAQHGPNSRFGRWRQWIEKRAAERYADLTPEDLARRRARGWGEGIDEPTQSAESGSGSSRDLSNGGRMLHIRTDVPASAIPISPPAHPPSPPPALIPEAVSPSHLELYQFGSRFLPHSTYQIRCLLPILNDQLLLIGHDNGLSVLDMFPREWADHGLTEKGPAEAETKAIWEGEVVYQMSILEAENRGQGTPQGVVLALVGPVADYNKEQEGIRSLRMYNLSSLISLAKWAVAQKGQHPLNLRLPHTPRKHGYPKRHGRHQGSLTKGLKNLVIDSPIAQPQSPPDPVFEPHTSYSDVADSPMYSKRLPPRPSERSSSIDSQSSWDVVDDLPLLWAAHYTPLASAGSRLHNTSVLFFDLWRNENQRSRGGVLLAVATKANIFMYEAPKGERAFRLIKEFYTPLTARSITFVQQSVVDSMSRSPSDVLPRSGGSSRHNRHNRVMSAGVNAYHYSNQLSLFVIFEKKAGLIRIADSAVGEVDLYETMALHQLFPPTMQPSSASRKSRASWDGRAFAKESRGVWVPPVKFSLPSAVNHSLSQNMYVLTRGKQSHIVPHPLPPSISAVAPYRVVIWSSPPAHVDCRVYTPPQDGRGVLPFLQLISFGEDGIEVQEIPLASLSERQRNGKRREEVPARAATDLGGETGFLCVGGQWSEPFHSSLLRSSSMDSNDSSTSSDRWSSEERVERTSAHRGIYGWVRKGLEDWRVFWVGGTGMEHDESDV